MKTHPGLTLYRVFLDEGDSRRVIEGHDLDAVQALCDQLAGHHVVITPPLLRQEIPDDLDPALRAYIAKGS